MFDDQITDAAVDEEVARLVAVEPSPGFEARVRRHIANERESRGPILPHASWIALAAAAAVAFIVVGDHMRHASQPAPSVRPLDARTLAFADVVSGYRARPQHIRPLVTPRTPAPPAHVGDGAGDAEVLVDPREGRAMRRLLDELVAGRTDVTPLIGPSMPPVMDPAPIHDLEIAPIEMTPLIEKGVHP